MSKSPPYTWKPYAYQPVAPAPPPPMPVLLAMPILVTPCVAVKAAPAPLKDTQVAGSDTAAKGKEMIVVETKTAIKGTSTKTVTKSASAAKAPSKPPSSAAKAPSKAPSNASSKAPSSAKAPSTAKPPSKPPSAAANSTTSSAATKKSSSSAAKTSVAVLCSKTIVSASTAVSKKAASVAASSVAVVAASTTSAKTTASQKAAKTKAITAPSPPLPGMKLMHPKHHTCLHVLRCKIWETPSATTTKLVAKTFFVPCSTTVTELIEQLLGKEGEKCDGWALTGVQEQGDGKWIKGGTVEFGGDKAEEVIKGLGWSELRGGERPPVWLVLHLV
ncbi:hypothetical protein E4T50_02628 [Aureobasidium sp. EXF-12298]|nr:hypothetical protein E4T50_02628 [Aureobasidium sp. EXF-12298]